MMKLSIFRLMLVCFCNVGLLMCILCSLVERIGLSVVFCVSNVIYCLVSVCVLLLCEGIWCVIVFCMIDISVVYCLWWVVLVFMCLVWVCFFCERYLLYMVIYFKVVSYLVNLGFFWCMSWLCSCDNWLCSMLVCVICWLSIVICCFMIVVRGIFGLVRKVLILVSDMLKCCNVWIWCRCVMLVLLYSW